MNKTEFESTDDGIQKGDLILVIATTCTLRPSAPDTLGIFVGLYDPVDNPQHKYLERLRRTTEFRDEPDLEKRLVNNKFFLNREPGFIIDHQSGQRRTNYLHLNDSRDLAYEACKYVKLLMKAQEVQQRLYSFLED